jgi:hypothetical protein
MKPRNRNNKKPIITIVIVLVIVALFFLVMLKQLGLLKNTPQQNETPPLKNESIKEYNGFTFKKELVGWSTLIDVAGQTYDLKTRFYPEDVEYIKIVNESAIKDRILRSDIVYIAIEPLMPSRVGLSAMEIAKVLNPRKNNTGILGIPTLIGVTYIPPNYNGKAIITDCTNASDFSIINKENATEPFASVIRYKINESNNNSIYIKDDCIIISGRNMSVLEEAGDRVVYSLLNVIP